jgi:hypothetical protein
MGLALSCVVLTSYFYWSLSRKRKSPGQSQQALDPGFLILGLKSAKDPILLSDNYHRVCYGIMAIK